MFGDDDHELLRQKLTFFRGNQPSPPIFVSLTLLESQQMMLPCGVYALLMMLTGTLLMGFFYRTSPTRLVGHQV